LLARRSASVPDPRPSKEQSSRITSIRPASSTGGDYRGGRCLALRVGAASIVGGAPEWRNWQTRWIQNPLPPTGRVGSSPTSGMTPTAKSAGEGGESEVLVTLDRYSGPNRTEPADPAVAATPARRRHLETASRPGLHQERDLSSPPDRPPPSPSSSGFRNRRTRGREPGALDGCGTRLRARRSAEPSERGRTLGDPPSAWSRDRGLGTGCNEAPSQRYPSASPRRFERSRSPGSFRNPGHAPRPNLGGLERAALQCAVRGSGQRGRQTRPNRSSAAARSFGDDAWPWGQRARPPP
jgi:hypothetical protein